MAPFRGGMEFTTGRPILLPPPPDVLPVAEVRLACTERPEVQAGQAVRQGQVLLRPTRAGSWFQVSPIAGTVRHVRSLGAPDGTGSAAAPDAYEVMIEAAAARSPTTLDVAAPRGRRLETWFPALRQIGAWSEGDGGVGFIAQLAAAQKQPVDTVVCVGLDKFPPYPDRSSLLASFPDDAALGTIVVGDLVGAKNTLLLAAHVRAVLSRLKPSCNNYALRLVSSANLYPQADPTLVAWHFAGRRRLAHGANPVACGLILLHPWTAIRIGRWFTRQCFDIVRPFFIAWPGGRPVLRSVYAMPGQPLGGLDERLGAQLERRRDSVLVGNPMTGRPVGGPGAAPAAPAGVPPVPAPATPPAPPPHVPPVPDDDLLITVLTPPGPSHPEPCISCGWCAEVCPTSLRPIHLAQLALTHKDDAYLLGRLAWCVDCGLCSHVCPANLPLAQVLRQADHALGRFDPVAKPLPIQGARLVEDAAAQAAGAGSGQSPGDVPAPRPGPADKGLPAQTIDPARPTAAPPRPAGAAGTTPGPKVPAP